MSYERGFEALANGDYALAASLLADAAQATGYASDLINHSYTLALYKSGDLHRLASDALRIGETFVADDPGSAMDYFQRALLGNLDAEGVERIETALKGWAAPVHASRPGSVRRAAHIVGGLDAHSPATRHAVQAARSLQHYGVDNTIFTTDRKSTRLNSSHVSESRMPSSA